MTNIITVTEQATVLLSPLQHLFTHQQWSTILPWPKSSPMTMFCTPMHQTNALMQHTDKGPQNSQPISMHQCQATSMTSKLAIYITTKDAAESGFQHLWQLFN